MSLDEKIWKEKGLTKLLVVLLLFLISINAMSAQEVVVFDRDLPYSEILSISINGNVGSTYSVDYDSWLTGQNEISFNDPLEDLEVFLNVPSSANLGNYTKNITLTSLNDSNDSINSFVLIEITEAPDDEDLDGFSIGLDCDDNDPDVNPNETEIYYNGKDDDCDASTVDEYDFSVTLNDLSLNIGENPVLTINAPPGSEVEIEVCETGEGFVPCFFPIRLTNTEYPHQEILPFTNTSGSYQLTATMNYNGVIRIEELTYEIGNSMQVIIDGKTKVKDGERVDLEATASGGISPYSYKWIRQEGGEIERKTFNHTYGGVGRRVVTLVVTDAADNIVEKELEIIVEETHEVIILIKNGLTQEPIRGVSVSVRGEDKTTDAGGRAVFKLTEASHDIVIFHRDFDILRKEEIIAGDITLNYELLQEDEDAPRIEIISPLDGSEIDGEAIFKFRVYDKNNVQCELFTNNGEDSFFESRDKIQIVDEGEKQFKLLTSGGKYSWKIECIDSRNNSAITEVRNLTIKLGDEKEPELSDEEKTEIVLDNGQKISKSERDSILTKIEESKEKLDKLGQKEREIATELGIFDDLKHLKRTIERAARDLNDLKFVNYMTDEEKIEREQELLEVLKTADKKIPFEFRVKESKEFVKYIKKGKIEEIYANYIEKESISKPLLDALNKLQNNIVISANTKHVLITYYDGSENEFTHVIKELKITGENRGVILAEYIPSEVTNIEEVIFVNEGNEIAGDLSLYKEEIGEIKKLIYKVNGLVPLADLQSTETLLIYETPPKDLKQISGASIFPVDFEFNLRSLLIFLIILIGLAYLYYQYGVGIISNVFDRYKKGSDELRFVNVLIDDAFNALEASELEIAQNLYKDIEQTYATLSPKSQETLRHTIISICNKIDLVYFQHLVVEIQNKLHQGNINSAAHEYSKLKFTYGNLIDENKKQVIGTLQKLSNAISEQMK